MRESDLIKNLKLLKTIRPKEDFSHALKHRIMSQDNSENHFLWFFGKINNIRFVPSLVLATLVIFFSINFFVSQEEIKLSGLDNEEILNELISAGDINIYLYEVSYFDELDEKINVALKEVANNE